MARSRRWLVPFSLLGLGIIGSRVIRRRRAPEELRGMTAVVTGGSRGLGLAIARELADEGCRLSICARDSDELERARADLESRGAEVMTTECDVSSREDVARLVAATTERFGAIDILVNNAGEITVGPVEHQTLDDFRRAMDIMFWGTVHPTLQVLSAMRERSSGHIVNITSIGGKVSVPRLLPYSSAKFAAVGFSEGLHAEVAGDGVHVLTVVPGLMRTGSHLNATFKGRHRGEFTWFSLGATLPITSISAEDAARRIVRGIRRFEPEIILSWQANVLARMHALVPGFSTNVLGLVDRMLPESGGIGSASAPGYASQTPLTESPIERLGQDAARRLNQ